MRFGGSATTEHAERIIRGCLRRFSVKAQDRDDVAQECRLALLEHPGDPPYWVILRRCRNVVRSQCRFEWRQSKGAVPEAYEVRTDSRIDAETFLARIPERHARILRLWAHGLPSSQIAHGEGCDESRIRQIVRESIRRLRA